MKDKFAPPAARGKPDLRQRGHDAAPCARGKAEGAPAAGREGGHERRQPGRGQAARQFGTPARSGGEKPFAAARRPQGGFGAAARFEDAPPPERIAKRLARAGIASRREAETMIAAGRIAVNGRVLASPAVNVGRADRITVDGQALPAKERTRLWLYHKPAGLVTTARDEAGRPTVFDSLPEALPRVVSVGRLDMNTEGLLLLTNDGGLARILELPSTGWVRHYRVRAHGKISQEQLDGLKDGIAVDGVFYGGLEAALEREQGSNVWLSVSLREGKNREIKNILGSLGLSVTRLIRTSFGPFRLGDLASGMVLEVRGRTLRDQLGEKLTEEAGLDFDAPITAPFPNAPVPGRLRRGGRDAAEGGFAERGAARGGEETEENAEGWISSGRRRPAMRPSEPAPLPRRAERSANVWHAPGSKARGIREQSFSRGDKGEFFGGAAEKRFSRADKGSGDARGAPERRGFGGKNSGAEGEKPAFGGREGRALSAAPRAGFQRRPRPDGQAADKKREFGAAERESGAKNGSPREGFGREGFGARGGQSGAYGGGNGRKSAYGSGDARKGSERAAFGKNSERSNSERAAFGKNKGGKGGKSAYQARGGKPRPRGA